MFGCGRFSFGGVFGGNHIFIMIFMVAILFIIAYSIYKFLDTKEFNYSVNKITSNPISMLNERLAKGEITIEEYEMMRNRIK